MWPLEQRQPLMDIQWLVWATLLASVLHPAGVRASGSQCGPPPPDQPFKVIWNHPDNCEKNKVQLNLDLYDIAFNEDRHMLGDQVLTLESWKTGPWPIMCGVKTACDGGVPQLFNVSAAQTRMDTESRLRALQMEDFRGVGAIKFRFWRPLFDHNSMNSFEPYKNKSIELVNQEHPGYSGKEAEQEAKREFEEGARRVFTAKLDIVQSVMPNGFWGYCGYPRSWDKDTEEINDRMDWLYRQATGLYPSLSRDYIVNRTMIEAVRIQKKYSRPNTAIFLYVMVHRATKENLEKLLTLPADMGASGVVLRGSTGYYTMNTSKPCEGMQAFIADILGPFVKNLTKFMTDCSNSLCAGHGRCVHNARDSLLTTSQSLLLSTKCNAEKPDFSFSQYHCRCYNPYTGPCCGKRLPSKCNSLGTDLSTSAAPPAGLTLPPLLLLLPLLLHLLPL